jgi:hypothetical protein
VITVTVQPEGMKRHGNTIAKNMVELESEKQREA